MSYRTILLKELTERKLRNPNYSLRAFARDTGVSATHLSRVLAEKRHLSEPAALDVTVRLKWDDFRAREFLLLHRIEIAATPEARREALSALRHLSPYGEGFSLVELDTFAIISRWYHMAIVEWARVAALRGDFASLGARFGISVIEAELAVERLLALGFLVRESDGALRPHEPKYTVRELPSAAIRNFHAAILQKARSALDEQAPQERDFSGVTMAIDPAFLPQARARIRAFTSDLMEFLESQGNPSAVFQLAVQLFRLDREPGR